MSANLPTTSMDVQAVYWNEVTSSFERAGYSREEALGLTAVQMGISAQIAFMQGYGR